MFDHRSLKNQILTAGKSIGLNKGDLHVLARDPFFVGTDKDYDDANWVSELWARMMAKRKTPLHLRGFHYWVQSQAIPKTDGQIYAYKDAQKDWNYMLRAVQIARYLGIGDWHSLVDMKHPNPKDFDKYLVGAGIGKAGDVDIKRQLDDKLEGLEDELLRDLVNCSPQYKTDGYQTYHLEVLCEKNSMGFVIEPACKKYGACYQAFIGQASVEKIDMMSMRAIKAARVGKKVRIFYIADFDRYGWSMVTAVARKIEFTLMQCGIKRADVKLTRLALNEDHIKKFKLPMAPKNGEAVVELDALEAIHPGELGKMVNNALKPYFDKDTPKLVDVENRRMRQAVLKMLEDNLRVPLDTALLGVDIEEVDTVAKELDLASVIDKNYAPPVPTHIYDDSAGNWVLDTGRGYWAQFKAYKAYKGDRVEEKA